MAFSLNEANNAYNAVRRFYGSQGERHLPADENGLFMDFAGVNKIVLLVTINAMRENWDLGWFTNDNTQRAAAFSEIAAEVWMLDKFQCDINGIIKFENWVFVACNANENLIRYFSGGVYGDLTDVFTTTKEKITDIATSAKDVITDIVTIPGESVNLVSKIGPWLKWIVIIYGASKILDFITEKA